MPVCLLPIPTSFVSLFVFLLYNFLIGAPGVDGIANPIAGIDMVSKAKQSRGEKKARKLMSKLGLKPVCLLFNC